MPTLRRGPKGADATPHDATRIEEVDMATRDDVNNTAVVGAATAATDKSTIPLDGVEKSSAKIPTIAQFPLVTAISLGAAYLGYTLVGELTKGELAAVSRGQESLQDVGILVAWRIFELALGWFGGLDSLDFAVMGLLSHGPVLYLLFAFYNLSPTTAFASLAIEVFSASAPVYLMRPLSAVHKSSSVLPNRELIDLPLQLLTTVLSTSIYTVTLVLSLRFILPRIFVVYFNGIPSVESAYAASYPTVLPATLLFGAAASTFIFPPFATTGKAKEDEQITAFDPAEASLGETVWWNFWGYTAKAKVVISRTALALLVTGVNTYLACTLMIPGVEAAGAAAYAGVWVVAAFFTGVGLGFVGRD